MAQHVPVQLAAPVYPSAYQYEIPSGPGGSGSAVAPSACVDSSYQNDEPEKHRLLQRPTYHAPAPALHAYVAREPEITLKVKYRNRYRLIKSPANASLDELRGDLAMQMNIKQAQASLASAYFLWLVFGFMGVHRWYLGKHNALSWFLWFITGQLFGFGWLWDGFSLWYTVRRYNERGLADHVHCCDILGLSNGRLDDYVPSLPVAYILWFFFGFAGIHRWYLKAHSTASHCAWFFTGQMFGLGWLWDAYAMIKLADHPVRAHSTFVVKIQDANGDYMPIRNDLELAQARLAHSLLLFSLGAHHYYLEDNVTAGEFLTRIITANYFVLGWICEGIVLLETIERSNASLLGTFTPAAYAQQHWPTNAWLLSSPALKSHDV